MFTAGPPRSRTRRACGSTASQTPWPIDPNATGNGLEGGTCIVNFAIDAGTRGPLRLRLWTCHRPGPSCSRHLRSRRRHRQIGETDDFTIALAAGQKVTVDVTSSHGAADNRRIDRRARKLDSDGAAVSPDSELVLQTQPVAMDGVYTVRSAASPIPPASTPSRRR